MKRQKVIEFNNALNSNGLKVKYLSANSYANLIPLKRSMIKYLNEMGENEQEFFLSHEVNESNFYDLYKGEFKKKLDLIRDNDFEYKELNFIPFDEFKKFTDDIDFNNASILSEYLLKNEIH